MLKIITVKDNEKYLRQVSKELTASEIQSKHIQQLIDEMLSTLKTGEDKAGLSAIQIGESIRLFVTEIIDDDFKMIGTRVFINPVIEITDFSQIIYEEGCLSIPDVWGNVARYKKIRVTYLDRKGERVKEKFEDFNARFIQHEDDHLNGILFTDKVVK